MSTTNDEGLTYTSHAPAVRPGDEAQVIVGLQSSVPSGMDQLFHVVGVLVSDVAAIKAKLGIVTTEPATSSVAESGLEVEATTAPVRPGDESTTTFVADPSSLPPPAPVAEAPAVDPTKEPSTVPLGGTGTGTGDASQPAEQDLGAAVARLPQWAQDLIHGGGHVEGV